jgi:GNAT superfamily N-acetyltransferase
MSITYQVEDAVVRAFEGEEQVGRISVPDIDFHWGEKVYVKMAGIAGVGTNEAFRGRGIASRMMEEARGFAVESGYSCSGISTNIGNVARRLYARAGYTTLFKPGEFVKRLQGPRPHEAAGVEIRPYREGDEGRLMGLFEGLYAPFFGWRRKTSARWHALRKEVREQDPAFLFVAEDEEGLQGWAGYFRQWIGLVSELHVRPSGRRMEVARALLIHLENHLLDRGIDARIWAPPGDLFAKALLAADGYAFREARVFMVSVLDLPGLLDALCPLLSRRLAGASPWRGVIRVETPTQEGFLRIGEGASAEERGRPDVEVLAPQEVLVRMLAGVLTPWEAYLEGLLSVAPGMTPEVRSFLTALFPETPWFHPADDLW